MNDLERDSDEVNRCRGSDEVPVDHLFKVHHALLVWKLSYQQWSLTLQEMVMAWALRRGCELVNTDNPYPSAESGSRASRER